jgi:glutamate dehydrogenase (NAD(P)+)
MKENDIKIHQKPMFTVEVVLEEFDTLGWVAIHSIGYNGSCGGVRLYPDVTREEVESLAFAMTCKYSLLNYNIGGAKAGLRMPFDIDNECRKSILRAFGCKIAPLIRKHIYTPWTDMNCSNDDIESIYEGAGKKLTIPCGNSSLYTAVSVFHTIKAIANFLNIVPSNCRIVIEGLGNVGGYLAGYIRDWNAPLTGVSTRRGAIMTPQGLDIEKILFLKQSLGDRFVECDGSWQKSDIKELFSQPCEVFVPCARPASINEQTASTINCRAIIPAANMAFTSKAIDILKQRDIIAMPDFVANSGGILGSGLTNAGATLKQINELYASSYYQMILRYLTIASRNNIDLYHLALNEICLSYQELVRSALLTRRPQVRLLDKFMAVLQPLNRGTVLRRKLKNASQILESRFTT